MILIHKEIDSLQDKIIGSDAYKGFGAPENQQVNEWIVNSDSNI